MKKDFIDKLNERRHKKKKEKKLIEEKRNKLSLKDLNAYEELLERRIFHWGFTLTTMLLKVFLFVTIFSGLFVFAIGETITYFRVILISLLQSSLRFLVLALIIDSILIIISPKISNNNRHELNRELFLGK